MTIPFTQFLLPNGERRSIQIHRPFAIQMKAREILNLGYRFECEVLTNGTVSLTIAGKDCDVGIELSPNDREVPLAVDRLIMAFDKDRAKAMEDMHK